MKTLLCALVLLVTATSQGQIIRVGPEDGSTVFCGYGDGKKFNFEIRPQDLSGKPAWKTDQEHPPLAPKKAEKLATSKLQTLMKNPADWTRREIVLHDMKYGNHWLYVVHFSGQVRPNREITQMVVIVLMDGTTPEPTVIDFP